jgi:hypothetical protein
MAKFNSTIYKNLADSLANVTAEVKVTSSVQNCENIQIWIKIKSGIIYFCPTFHCQASCRETYALIVTYF